jgi:hypothetical protein
MSKLHITGSQNSRDKLHHVYNFIFFFFFFLPLRQLLFHLVQWEIPSDSIKIQRIKHISKLSDEILYHTHATYLLISPSSYPCMLYLFPLFCYEHDFTKTSHVDNNLIPAPLHSEIISFWDVYIELDLENASLKNNFQHAAHISYSNIISRTRTQWSLSGGGGYQTNVF